jgi:phosphoserine aminotransferase
LPTSVLEKIQQSIICTPGLDMSILGISHRSTWFEELLLECESNMRELLHIPNDHSVLFLQGGSSLQFSMIPMNFLRGSHEKAHYIVSGHWSQRAFHEAHLEGKAEALWNGQDKHFSTLPLWSELNVPHKGAYLHYVSNETVEGLSFSQPTQKFDLPLVADMSSDLLSGPIDVEKFDFIYAHTQKNMGPPGVTVVIAKRQWLESSTQVLPSMLDYKTHLKAKSNYNTPNVMSIYVLKLITDWLIRDIGGLQSMQKINIQKAQRLYQTLERHPDQIQIHADKAHRSNMNVSFSLKNSAMQSHLLDTLDKAHFSGLQGHRTLGGLRASLYNAVSQQAVDELCVCIDQFMKNACI